MNGYDFNNVRRENYQIFREMIRVSLEETITKLRSYKSKNIRDSIRNLRGNSIRHVANENAKLICSPYINRYASRWTLVSSINLQAVLLLCNTEACKTHSGRLWCYSRNEPSDLTYSRIYKYNGAAHTDLESLETRIALGAYIRLLCWFVKVMTLERTVPQYKMCVWTGYYRTHLRLEEVKAQIWLNMRWNLVYS